MKGEYKSKCDLCNKKGVGVKESIFARIFYRKIKNEWKWLCRECWNKQDDNITTEST